jgi:HK97 family phage prohead protease
MLVSIEQAIRRSVMTPAQRSTMTAEFNFDALLRASLKDRMEIYAKAVQNGIYSRNQARQLENDPPYAGGDTFTAQTNLAPVDMLGKLPPGRNEGTAMLIRKTLSLADVDLKFDGEKGSFSGYASTFGGVDSYGDTILRGAFDSTLRLNGKPKMFFNHAWDMPIGKYSKAKEDEHGLFVEGEITPGMSLANDVRAAMLHGTIDGLSIGGFIKKGDYDETETGRVIRRWESLIEISPVVFPADKAARIDLGSVKGANMDDVLAELDTVRDFERFLRDVGGLSKGAAQAVVARAKLIFIPGEPEGETGDVKALRTVEALLERAQRLHA